MSHTHYGLERGSLKLPKIRQDIAQVGLTSSISKICYFHHLVALDSVGVNSVPEKTPGTFPHKLPVGCGPLKGNLGPGSASNWLDDTESLKYMPGSVSHTYKNVSIIKSDMGQCQHVWQMHRCWSKNLDGEWFWMWLPFQKLTGKNQAYNSLNYIHE